MENINKKFILCKKRGDDKWKVYEKTLSDTLEECFNYVIGKLKIDIKEEFSKFTYEKYIEESKDLVEKDLSLEKLLKNDGISKEFFDEFDAYEYICANGEIEYLVYDKGELDYSEILKVLTTDLFEINRVEKILKNPERYSISLEALEAFHKEKECIKEKIRMIKEGKKDAECSIGKKNNKSKVRKRT